jgi:hypothetical protein
VTAVSGLSSEPGSGLTAGEGEVEESDDKDKARGGMVYDEDTEGGQCVSSGDSERKNERRWRALAGSSDTRLRFRTVVVVGSASSSET